MFVTWARAGAIAGAWGNPPRPSRQLRAKSGATPSLSEATETPWFVQCKSSACLPDLSLAHTASKAAGLALGGPGGQGGEAAGPSGVRTQAHLLFAWLHCGRLKVSRGQWLSDVRGRERSLLRRLGRSDRTCCLTGRSEPHRHQVNLPASGHHHEAAPHAAGCPAPGYDAGDRGHSLLAQGVTLAASLLPEQRLQQLRAPGQGVAPQCPQLQGQRDGAHGVRGEQAPAVHVSEAMD